MLMQRIMGALTFKKEVYAEVEKDTSFTSTAWLIVAVVSFINAIGSRASLISGGIGGWIIGVIVGTIFAVLGFALGCFVISWLGKAMFKADVNFEEMVRVLGLAYVWNAVAFLGIFSAIIPAAACILGPVQIVAALAGLAAWLIAAKEALDLEWLPTIITVVVGFVVNLIVIGIASVILGLFGIVAGGAMQMLQGG